jgi:hypothetical protein
MEVIHKREKDVSALDIKYRNLKYLSTNQYQNIAQKYLIFVSLYYFSNFVNSTHFEITIF